MLNPHTVSWKLKSKGNLVADIVGHIPKEISRADCSLLERGGRINGKVYEEEYILSPVPKGELEIMLSIELRITDEKRNILEHYKEITQSNYLENADTNNYQINDLAVINLQNEGFGE